jgi:hypothetical protein
LYNGHISTEQIELLSEQGHETSEQTGEVWSHIENCQECRALLERYRAFDAKLAKLSSEGVQLESTMTCPDENIWFEVAAGTLPANESLRHAQHAATCDSCGKKLKAATRLFESELSSQEEQILNSLPSSRTQRQQIMAEQLSQVAKAASQPELTYAEKKKPRRPLWRFFALACAVALAVLAVLPWASAAYTKYQILSAYREWRPMNYRLPNVPYGPPPNIERGPKGIRARYVADSTNDPQLSAAALLLRLDSSKAIAMLEDARKSGSPPTSLLDALVVAYAMEAEHANSNVCHPNDCYQHALELVTAVIDHNPDDKIAFFNRAMVLKNLNRDYSADLKRYLDIERDDAWIRDANALLPH